MAKKVKLELTMEELGHIILYLFAGAGKKQLLKEAQASLEEEGVKVQPLSLDEEDRLFEKLMVPYRW